MFKNNDNKKKMYFLLLCLTVVITLISGTYAYFTASKSVDNVLTGETATVSFGLAVKKVTDADNIVGVIPMDDVLAPFASYNRCYDNYGKLGVLRAVTNLLS